MCVGTSPACATSTPDATRCSLAPKNGQKLTGNAVYHAFKDACAQANIQRNFRLHDLRHAAATYRLLQGQPLESVSRMLGHSSVRITSDTYLHLNYEAMAQQSRVASP